MYFLKYSLRDIQGPQEKENQFYLDAQMRSNIPLISGPLKDSVYELADITDPVKLSSRFNNKTEKDT